MPERRLPRILRQSRSTTLRPIPESGESQSQGKEVPISGNVTTEQQGDDEAAGAFCVIEAMAAAEPLDRAITMLPMPPTTPAKILPKAWDS